MVTRERLVELFNYDNGVFRRKLVNGSTKRAGTPDKDGYIQIQIDGKIYKAHQLVWLHEEGEFPGCGLDHIDTITSNNARSNLRKATDSQNQQNKRKPYSNSKVGLLGVSICSRNKSLYKATIVKDKKQVFLGRFICAIAAHGAYLKAKRDIHEFGTI